MADKELTDLTALGASPATGDLFLIRDISDTTDGASGTDKKVSYSDFQSGLSITESQISNLGSYIALTSLSVGAEGSASGDGAISYNSSTGVFTYTPPTLAGLNGSANDLSDVTLTSTAANDILSWNGSAFVNTDAPTLDSLQFDTGAAEAVGVGQMAWNADEECIDIGLDSDVTLQVGQEIVMRVKATEAIRNGMAVYASGQQGGSDNIEAKKFIASDATGPDELYFLGIATEELSLNEVGFLTTFGRVRGIDGRTHAAGGIRDDADGTSWSVGDILYVSENIAGALTSIPPTAPDREMAIAWVLATPNETNITLFVRAEHGYHLDEIHDVDIDESNITDNEVLSWDSGTGRWINQTLAELGGGGGSVTSVAATVPTGFTISGSPITSSGTLAVAFDTGYSLPTTTNQSNWTTAYGWGDHSTQGYLTAITGENLSSLADVTITSIASGELLKWNGSAWINNTLAEAGVAAASHTHTESDITDLQSYLLDITGENLSSLSDVTITSIASGELLKWNGSAWINNTLAEAGVAAASHNHAASAITSGTLTHERGGLEADVSAYSGLLKISAGVTSQITDNSSNWDTAYGWGDHSVAGYLTDITGEALSTLSDVTITSIASGELLKWNGSAWINQTLAEAGIAATSHTHATSDITSGTFADARIAESNVTQHQAALSITESQVSDLGSYIPYTVGGHIDMNGNVLGDGTRALLGFTEDASAVNYIEIENEATGGGPIIRSTGTDANPPLNIQTKGTGSIFLESLEYSEANKKISYADITGAGIGTALTISSAGVDNSNTQGATGGALTLKTGDAADATGGTSGSLTLQTGLSTSGASGALTITTGASESANSGDVTIATGGPATSGNAGDIILSPAADAVGGTYGAVRPGGDNVQDFGSASNRWLSVYQTTNYFVETGAGTNFVALTAPSSIASNVTWTLPSEDGTAGQVLTTDGAGTLYWDDDSQGAGGGGSSSANTEDITQASHGFAVGDLLKFASGSYAKAQADSAANSEVVGIVSATSGANDFTITYSGRVDGLSGLSANTTYFLDPSTAGALTATEPTTSGDITKPVLVATSTTSGIFITYRGAVVSSGTDDLDYQWIGAGAMIPYTTNGAAAGTTQGTINGVMKDTLDFDASTEEGCAFWTNFGQKWNEGTVKVKFYWTAQSGSGTVRWNIAGQTMENDSQIDQGVGSDSQEDVAGITDTFLLADDNHTTEATEALTVSNAVAGEPVYFEVTRDVAIDTLAVDAQLIGVMIEYTKTSASGW